jgi:SAM-dependent methyltransferase
MEWFDSSSAQTLLHREEAMMSELLPTLFGYHMLQLGRLFDGDAFIASPIKHQMSMSLQYPAPGAGLVARAESLPFKRESLDLVVMPHVLEFSPTPHTILREVDRCLIPEGHVLIFGFNPWSHWQLLRAVLRWRQAIPWRGRYLSQRRLGDWLKLLGFDVLESKTFLFRPPLRNPVLMERLRFLEPMGERILPWMGGAYLLLARKRVETLTPLRPRLKTPRAVIGVGLSGSPRV